MSDHIWVKDPGTGHQFPMLKSEADALGDAVKVDPKHPTHDAGGELLHPVYKTTVADAAGTKSGQSANTETEK